MAELVKRWMCVEPVLSVVCRGRTAAGAFRKESLTNQVIKCNVQSNFIISVHLICFRGLFLEIKDRRNRD